EVEIQLGKDPQRNFAVDVVHLEDRDAELPADARVVGGAAAPVGRVLGQRDDARYGIPLTEDLAKRRHPLHVESDPADPHLPVRPSASATATTPPASKPTDHNAMPANSRMAARL